MIDPEDKRGYNFAAAAAAHEARINTLKERLGGAVLGGIVIDAMQRNELPTPLFKVYEDATKSVVDMGYIMGPTNEPGWAVNLDAELLRVKPLTGGRVAITEIVDPQTLDPFWLAAMADHTQQTLSR
ncbi:MAG TPA: hypothetical protein VLF43_05155 [Candidatus Saccharimonadales bacterium]|nr:hypothetical protein [Candidatus Saccharimonadales bacterium]